MMMLHPLFMTSNSLLFNKGVWVLKPVTCLRENLQLSHRHPETRPELAVVQFHLFCEEVKLRLSVPALYEGAELKPSECPVKTVKIVRSYCPFYFPAY